MGDRVMVRFVADVHVGNHKRFGGTMKAGVNDRCRRILGVLADAAAGTDTLVVLGDLFDVSNPTPQVVAATLDALTWGRSQEARHIELLLGNHEMVSIEEDDNALACFKAMAHLLDHKVVMVGVHETPRWQGAARGELYMIPFRPEPCSEWFAETVTQLHSQLRWPSPILCFHAGVRDHNTPKYLWSSPDAIDVDLLFDVMRSSGSKLAVCGNWHNHRVWKRDGMTVVQVGALVPTGFDNPGSDYGHVVDIMDDGEVVIGRQLPGPRFLTLSRQAAFEWVEPPANADGCYVRVTVPPGESEDVDRLRAEFGDDVLAVELVTPAEDTAAQEAEAAEAARTGETLESSLRDYVQAMPLNEGIDRAAVEAKVLNYLARG